MALAAVLAAVVLAPTAAHAAAAPETSTYLALGDSISFGYTAERFKLHESDESPSFFEEGFTNGFLKDLRKGSEIGKTATLVNDACPGETSNGLIGENEALGGSISTESYEEVEGKPATEYPEGGYQGLGDYHPCKYTFRTHLPLHNGGYVVGGKEVSQLEEALSTLKSNVSKVKAITINIGSNDELAAIKQCENEVAIEYGTEGKSKYGPSPSVATIGCIKTTDENVTIPHILSNFGDILTQIDDTGYTGPIIVLGFYNPDTFVLPGSDELQKGTNTALENEVLVNFPNVAFANPFPVFNKDSGVAGKSKKEEEAVCKYTEMCNDGDIHPTIAGYKELAKLVNAAYVEYEAKV
jgi:lysophospholipase L1-like esterase